MTRTILQVFGGLLASGGIFYLAVVLAQGPLERVVAASGSPLLWAGIMYAPFPAIGIFSFVRNMKALGLTLITAGLVAAVAFYGFVNGLYGSF